MKIKTSQTMEITPALLADAFYQMDDAEQREFFEACAYFWKGADFDSQMHHVTHNGKMSFDAMEIMRIIGDNSFQVE